MRKGFTLIELLVVIAIVAILSVVVILVINPAELLAQARDSNRINDLQNIKTAIATYLADVSSPSLGTGEYATHIAGTVCTNRYVNCTGAANRAIPTTANLQKTDGTGWIPVILNNVSSGSPLPAYPVDPTNSTTYYYTYRNGTTTATTNTFELTAQMESNKYKSTSTGPGATDGGANIALFEVGTFPGLNM